MIAQIQEYVNPMYLVALLTLSYTFRDIGVDLLHKIFRIEIRRMWIVIIIAGLLAVPFYISDPCDDCLMKLLITYCVGTSMYETFLKSFEGILNSFFKSS